MGRGRADRGQRPRSARSDDRRRTKPVLSLCPEPGPCPGLRVGGERAGKDRRPAFGTARFPHGKVGDREDPRPQPARVRRLVRGRGQRLRPGHPRVEPARRPAWGGGPHDHRRRAADRGRQAPVQGGQRIGRGAGRAFRRRAGHGLAPQLRPQRFQPRPERRRMEYPDQQPGRPPVQQGDRRTLFARVLLQDAGCPDGA